MISSSAERPMKFFKEFSYNKKYRTTKIIDENSVHEMIFA